MPASGGRLIGEAVGEVEREDGVLVLRRVHVVLKLRAAEEHHEVAQHVHRFFAHHCPVYRSLRPALEITTELELLPSQP